MNSSSIVPLLDAFAKLRKTTISFVVSVRMSVRMEQFGSHWTDEIFSLIVFIGCSSGPISGLEWASSLL